MGLREFSNVPPDPRDWGRWMRAQFITADSVAPNTITTGMIQDAQVTFAKFQDLNALSVMGRPVNSAGVASSIAAANDGEVLRRSGTTIGFGPLLAASVSDFTEAAQDAVAAALTDSSTIDLIYVDATPAISAAIITDSVSNTLLANMAQDTIKGRASGAGTGDPTDLTAAQVATIISSAIASALNIVTGVYTPTLTIVTNLDSVTAAQCQYMRVGTTVVVSGRFTADATAAGLTEFGLSLPIASNIGAREDLGGVGSSNVVAGQVVEFSGDLTNDRAAVRWTAVDTASRVHNFIFMYRVI